MSAEEGTGSPRRAELREIRSRPRSAAPGPKRHRRRLRAALRCRVTGVPLSFTAPGAHRAARGSPEDGRTGGRGGGGGGGAAARPRPRGQAVRGQLRGARGLRESRRRPRGRGTGRKAGGGRGAPQPLPARWRAPRCGRPPRCADCRRRGRAGRGKGPRRAGTLCAQPPPAARCGVSGQGLTSAAANQRPSRWARPRPLAAGASDSSPR